MSGQRVVIYQPTGLMSNRQAPATVGHGVRAATGYGRHGEAVGSRRGQACRPRRQAYEGAMNTSRHVLLFGAESSICIDLIESLRRAGIGIAGSILTGPPEWDQDGIEPVVPEDPLPDRLRGIPCVLPWLAPGLRRDRALRAERLGLEPLDALVDPTAVLPRAITIGRGAYVNSGVTVGGQVSFGQYVFLNRGSSVGHHSLFDDFVSLGPGAVVAARVRLGRGVFVGAGAVVAPGVQVGANTVIGSGASVFRDLPANVLAVGNPARIARTGVAGYQGIGV